MDRDKKLDTFLTNIMKTCEGTIKNNKFTVEEKHLVKTRIGKLSENEMGYIFTTVVSHGETYHRNKNGIFLDLNKLSDNCYFEIQQYVDKIFSTRILS